MQWINVAINVFLGSRSDHKLALIRLNADIALIVNMLRLLLPFVWVYFSNVVNLAILIIKINGHGYGSRYRMFATRSHPNIFQYQEPHTHVVFCLMDEG